MVNILVVEDDKSVREIIRDLLITKKYKVDTANSASEAILLLDKNDYDVIITDMRMEKLDKAGLDVLKAAKKKDPIIQVIVLTAYGSLTDAVESMETGAFTYLEKKGESTDEYDILCSQIQRALVCRASLAYAASDLTKTIDTAMTNLVTVRSQIEECMNLLSTTVCLRKRLLDHLHIEEESMKPTEK